MNIDFVAPENHVFYLRGTTEECVPIIVVGLLSFTERVTISYERPGHTKVRNWFHAKITDCFQSFL